MVINIDRCNPCKKNLVGGQGSAITVMRVEGSGSLEV